MQASSTLLRREECQSCWADCQTADARAGGSSAQATAELQESQAQAPAHSRAAQRGPSRAGACRPSPALPGACPRCRLLLPGRGSSAAGPAPAGRQAATQPAQRSPAQPHSAAASNTAQPEECQKCYQTSARRSQSGRAHVMRQAKMLRLTGMLGVPLVSAPVSAALLAAALLASHCGWAGSWSRGGSAELMAARHSLRTISSSKLLMLPWLEKKSESSCSVMFTSSQSSRRKTCRVAVGHSLAY